MTLAHLLQKEKKDYEKLLKNVKIMDNGFKTPYSNAYYLKVNCLNFNTLYSQ